MNNEEQVIDTIKRCKEFPIILELHNKYFNKLLGKKVKFSFKSFSNMMKDLMYDTYLLKSEEFLISISFAIELEELSMHLEIKRSNDGIVKPGFWLTDKGIFLWSKSFIKFFEKWNNN